MSKYSEEFKLKVVDYYMNNNYGWEYVSKQFNIPAYMEITKAIRKQLEELGWIEE